MELLSLLFVFGGGWVFNPLHLVQTKNCILYLFIFLPVVFLFRVCQSVGIVFEPFFWSPISLCQSLLRLARRIIIFFFLQNPLGFHYHLLFHLYPTLQSGRRTQKSGALVSSQIFLLTLSFSYLLIMFALITYHSYCEDRVINR